MNVSPPRNLSHHQHHHQIITLASSGTVSWSTLWRWTGTSYSECTLETNLRTFTSSCPRRWLARSVSCRFEPKDIVSQVWNFWGSKIVLSLSWGWIAWMSNSAPWSDALAPDDLHCRKQLWVGASECRGGKLDADPIEVGPFIALAGGDGHLPEDDESENCADGLRGSRDFSRLRRYLHWTLLSDWWSRNLHEGNFKRAF